MGEHGEHRASHGHLRHSEAEHRLAHDPEALRPQFQSDKEEQHCDAELGDIANLVNIRDKVQPRRTDDGAADEISQNAPEARPPR